MSSPAERLAATTAMLSAIDALIVARIRSIIVRNSKVELSHSAEVDDALNNLKKVIGEQHEQAQFPSEFDCHFPSLFSSPRY